jgi:hypothetical protein
VEGDFGADDGDGGAVLDVSVERRLVLLVQMGVGWHTQLPLGE